MKLFKKLTIAKKMILSYAFIIFILTVVSLISLVLFMEASRQQEYISVYILDRSGVLAQHSDTFPVLRRTLRDTFLDRNWYNSAGVNEMIYVNANFEKMNHELERLTLIYIDFLERDSFMDKESKEYVINMAYALLDKVRTIRHYIIFLGVELCCSLEDLEEIGKEIYRLIEASENTVRILRAENRLTIGMVLGDISDMVANSFILIFSGIAFSIAASCIISFMMIYKMSKSIGVLKNNARAVRDGNFDDFIALESNDEISELSDQMEEVTSVLKHLVDEIDKASLETEKGNEYIRVDDTDFFGGYKSITSAINLLIEKVKQLDAVIADSNAKSKFLAYMSHEIRSPLNIIMGITEIQFQKSDAHSYEVSEAFEQIYVSGSMLLDIVNDILDLSKIEAGKIEIHMDEYDVASMLNDAIILNTMHIGSKQIEFEISVDEAMPAYLVGDELRIKQILYNLLSNAFKYTDEGMVKMFVYIEEIEQNPEQVALVISVSDTGQGMTDEQIGKIFEPYMRFSSATNRFAEGSGLGMNIISNLISLMDGTISVESEPGKGSTFIIRLAQGKSGDKLIGKENIENLKKFRLGNYMKRMRVQVEQEYMPYGKVLIVDDVSTNIYIAKCLLRPYALQIDSVETGFAAIDRVKRKNVYDIIFMDHMMPVMDGVETVRHIREMGYDNPIVALTANALVGQMEMFLENGFDDFISKPIDVRQLNSILNKFVRDRHPGDVVESARHKAKVDAILTNSFATNLIQSSEIVEIFDIDGNRYLTVLSKLIEKGMALNPDELREFTIHIHGLKSVLASIGKSYLANLALKLETLCREGDVKMLVNESPDFIKQLKALMKEIASLKGENSEHIGENREDKQFLYEKLKTLQAACINYNIVVAEAVLNELKSKLWSQDTKNLLDFISEQLLFGGFREIEDAVKKVLEE